MFKNNDYAIKHRDFDDIYSALFKNDGVHLSFFGNDIFVNTIRLVFMLFNIMLNVEMTVEV